VLRTWQELLLLRKERVFRLARLRMTALLMNIAQEVSESATRPVSVLRLLFYVPPITGPSVAATDVRLRHGLVFFCLFYSYLL